MLELVRNKTVQGVSGWVGLLSAAGTLLGKLTPQWFGALTWSQAILAGVGFALLVTFALALSLLLGAYGCRVLRPSRLIAADKPIGSDALALASDVAALVERVDNLTERFQAAAAATTTAVALSEKIERVRVDGELNRRDLIKIEAIQKDERERRQGSLYALGARERLSKLQAAVSQDAAKLYDPLHAGEVYNLDRWSEWESLHGRWEQVLNQWLEEAKWYAVAVKEHTLTIDDQKYGLTWSVGDNQFPSAEANRRFKRFRIIHQQWVDVLPNVQSGLNTVAFSGLTDLEARSGRPAE